MAETVMPKHPGLFCSAIISATRDLSSCTALMQEAERVARSDWGCVAKVGGDFHDSFLRPAELSSRPIHPGRGVGKACTFGSLARTAHLSPSPGSACFS